MLTAACRSYYWSVASFCGSVLPPSFCLSVKNHTIHLQSVYECLAHRASVSRTVSGVDILESWRDEGGFSCVRWDLEHTWHRRTNRVFNWKAAFFRNNQECNAQMKHECGEIQITKPTKKNTKTKVLSIKAWYFFLFCTSELHCRPKKNYLNPSMSHKVVLS